MKRGILVLLSLSVLVAVAYFTASKWAIRHETIAFHDPDRDNRLVAEKRLEKKLFQFLEPLFE